jgi:hypothetical protein
LAAFVRRFGRYGCLRQRRQDGVGDRQRQDMLDDTHACHGDDGKTLNFGDEANWST